MNAYKPGDRVWTPAHGIGTLLGYNNGTRRERTEACWNISVPGLMYAVWYYESELKPA